jgi:hypothetical protein
MCSNFFFPRVYIIIIFICEFVFFYFAYSLVIFYLGSIYYVSNEKIFICFFMRFNNIFPTFEIKLNAAISNTRFLLIIIVKCVASFHMRKNVIELIRAHDKSINCIPRGINLII